jgi:type I restriction enzyme, S subunit
VTATPIIALGEIMASRSGSVDPSKHLDEVFELYSIPAFDSGRPELVAGRAIGSAKQVVRPGDVLLSRIVPHIRRSWVVRSGNGRRLIASGEWIVFRSDRLDEALRK